MIWAPRIVLALTGALATGAHGPATPPEAAEIVHAGRVLPLHPATLDHRPDLPSPLVLADGREFVVLHMVADRWSVVPVTAADPAEQSRQGHVDAEDFPTLARTGLHDEQELAATRTITGRSVAEITELGRPGRLSSDGFMAADEDVVSVLIGDNRLVAALGLTHPELARPLWHVWNLINAELAVEHWNMAEHRWANAAGLLYHGVEVRLEAHDTKGGQKSIFADDLDGAFHIEIHREPTAADAAFLVNTYGRLAPEERATMIARLTRIDTGEMEAYYARWYGFYEGHTFWRADPVALAWIFGLRDLAAIEAAFPGRLHEVLTAHHTRSDEAKEGR